MKHLQWGHKAVAVLGWSAVFALIYAVDSTAAAALGVVLLVLIAIWGTIYADY